MTLKKLIKPIALMANGRYPSNPYPIEIINNAKTIICTDGSANKLMKHGLQPTILRPSNPFGPGQGHLGVQGVVATFFNHIKNKESINIWGDGSAIRDYIYISDLIDLCVKAGKSDKTGIYNAGMGQGCSLNDLVLKIKEVTGISPKIKYHSARAFDVKRIILDITQAKKVFNWSPSVSIEEGLNLYWQWLQDPLE